MGQEMSGGHPEGPPLCRLILTALVQAFAHYSSLCVLHVIYSDLKLWDFGGEKYL